MAKIHILQKLTHIVIRDTWWSDTWFSETHGDQRQMVPRWWCMMTSQIHGGHSSLHPKVGGLEEEEEEENEKNSIWKSTVPPMGIVGNFFLIQKVQNQTKKYPPKPQNLNGGSCDFFKENIASIREGSLKKTYLGRCPNRGGGGSDRIPTSLTDVAKWQR